MSEDMQICLKLYFGSAFMAICLLHTSPHRPELDNKIFQGECIHSMVLQLCIYPGGVMTVAFLLLLFRIIVVCKIN